MSIQLPAPTANVKKADRPRYWVTHLFKQLEPNDIFKPSELHLTFIPWFVSEYDEKSVIKSFKEYFSSELKFEITVKMVDEFKNRRKIVVNLLYPSAELNKLHKKTLNWMKSLDGRWAVKSPYVDKDYVPHIRRRPGHNFAEGQKLQIDSLSLVKAKRRGDDQRILIAKVNLR